MYLQANLLLQVQESPLNSSLASGWSEEDLLENYPRLKKEHLQAVFAYIRECLKDGLISDLSHHTSS